MRVFIFLFLFVFIQSCFANENTLTFPNSCIKGNSIIIAAVGDVLLHDPLQVKASKWGFTSLWQEAIPYIQNAHIAYANLEGPMALGISLTGREVSAKANQSWGYNDIYSGFPTFNYHPTLAAALKDSGFSIVSTANNHCLDRFSIGIDKTIKALNKVGLDYVGTRVRGSQASPLQIINKNGVQVAWISCTENTNGFEDKYHQVLYCYKRKDRKWIMDTIQELKSQVDAIIILPHWGEEYETHPTYAQKEFAKQVLDAGATAVIGSHPHVLQPLEKYITKDGRATIIMYSLGNFVSYQGGVTRRSTVILFLGLTKTSETTMINGVRFVPMYMQNRGSSQGMCLTRLPNDHSLPLQIISRVMPMGNVLYSLPVITNPECH